MKMGTDTLFGALQISAGVRQALDSFDDYRALIRRTS